MSTAPRAPLRSFLHQHLPQQWQQRGWLARLLWPLSWLYGVVWQRKQRRTQQQPPQPLPVSVLVVGNMIAGGAGKTPVTLAVVQHFQRMGVHVGVVSRGYGRDNSAPHCMAVTSDSTASEVGDEPLLIHRRTGAPVVVCAQRLEAARALLQHYPDTQLIVCDDGLQHLALPRDAELCVMDERNIGNGWLLPAGPLREPWPRKTDWLLRISPTAETQQNIPLPPGQAVFHAQRRFAAHAVRADGATQPLAEWAAHKQPVQALAGIAQPERFFAMLRAAGLALQHTVALPDHATPDILIEAAQTLSQNPEPLLCTEKDAVKLWPHLPDVWAVPLELQMEPGFFNALTAWWQQQQSSPHRAS
ncbi:MAG: tetraacyldisaccharide 4'-kinase [Brachymonas sp.]|nr:tetraacyldisaccharide 4'-kinase [Brachymonas sp.]